MARADGPGRTFEVTASLRGRVSEPEPGRLLVEHYPADRTTTLFLVEPELLGRACRVTVSSRFPRRRGPLGWIERRLVTRMLEV